MNTLMKKLTAALLAGALALSLAACSQQPSSSGAAPSAAPAASSEASSEASAPAASSSEEAASGGAGDSATPDGVSVYSAPLDEDGYFQDVTALDFVTLPDLSTLKASEESQTVTDEEYAAELDSRLAEYTVQRQVTDRAVADGDTVNIDYVGSVDGVEFSGGSTGGKGTTVTIGVTNYIDDFLQQLIGHKPGETINVNVTFPTDYGKDELNGKDALFVTTINYIVEDVVPSLTDDFVASHWTVPFGWKTAAEAAQGLREEMRVTAVGGELWDKLLEQAQVSSVPAVFTDYQRSVVTAYYTHTAESYGLSLDDFLSQALGVQSMDDVFEQTKDNLEKNAKASLVMQALGEQLGLKATDDDITAYFGHNSGTVDWSQFLEEYGRPYLALLTREDMAKRQLAAR